MTASHDWVARTGDAWADEWRRTDRSFGDLSRRLEATILGVAPEHGRFVDIGSGAGGTSLAIGAARPEAEIVGIDLSPRLTATAALRGRGYPNLSFRTGDATTGVAALSPIDLLFSRHGVMFFADPIAAFAGLRRAAVPGAPLVFSCFRERARNAFVNDLARAVFGALPAEPAGYTPGPFAFASAEWVSAMLAAAGWRVASADPIDFAYVAGEGDDPVADAASFFSRIGPVGAALAAAAPEERARLVARLPDAVARWQEGDRVVFPAAAWIWTAYAKGEAA